MSELIVATLYRIAGASGDRVGEGLEMLDLWLQHLRGPGQYSGDIALVSNLPDVRRVGVRVVSPQVECHTVSDVQLLKVMGLCEMDLTPYGSVLHLDLDILAVGPVEPLFAQDHRIHTARSTIAMLDRRHAGHYVSPAMRRVWSCFPKSWIATANTCAISIRPEEGRRAMQRYLDLIRQTRERCPNPPLGDQTVLNWGMWRGDCRVELYPHGWIQHSNWVRSDEAILWHFPTSDRLKVMQRQALV